MEPPDVTFTVAYVVFVFCFVFTPNEFRSAGVTVQNIFSGWLGSEDINFIEYHIKRTSVTLLVHSVLPLGYYAGMCVAAPYKNLTYLPLASEGWQLYFAMCVTLPLLSGLLVLHWSRDKWAQHPISRKLMAHALPQSRWRAVASSINTEFRRIDKFATGAASARVIVTDSWVMKVTTYVLHVAQQQDVHLTVVESKAHEISPESNTPVQLLTISVNSINPSVKPFDIKLNSTEYGELRQKLHAPIRNAANVVIHQTLSDLFLETFKSHVEANQTYDLPSGQELESCIGCMQVDANTKLLRLCQEDGEGGPDGGAGCQRCYCRPMWCLTCMGKWFASRQDQQHPETWLSSRVPCPTCKARFCILDVCMVR
ncbi:E3 ubiquitin-protein ligase TM129 [Brienomyrus brachyistius]|uniref:E3 ubiquitin-protein ligase TM129 n=1 Tax=Brienomyrus brachyistius TaxID=42636 RepID=UPI0020B18297|nr:E3 ubiquitin-protein ligase TM129 [Brienomyrus brachyistius]